MSTDGPDDVELREAGPDDRVAVARVVDGAVLSVEDLAARLEAGEVLVAESGGRVVGTIVLVREGPTERGTSGGGHSVPAGWGDAVHVRALAVRRRRRDGGIGTALVRAAVERFGPIVADFDAGVAPFYRSLGAEVRSAGGDRCWALVEGP